jgi:deoxyribose-phosphate aldolase
MRAGADFIKTSTGKVTRCRLPVTLVMLEAIRDTYETASIE